MTTPLRKAFSFSFLLFIAVTLCSAQNLMTRRYPAASDGPINRGDFNEDGIPDVVFQTSTGIAVASVLSKPPTQVFLVEPPFLTIW
jgi:hypothetical protein